ncbi:hypothetical protein HMSSN139_46320 [Paenibacillus sp. HMSSN-139]|nr:hypothetical protein HMSSN139_46320 [Paenibacillus sp. HMSSN-139]
MAERSTKDLKINGVGQASGGAYRKIQTEGIATLNGDIACEALGANGTLKIKGTIDAGEFRLNGTGSSDGALQGGGSSWTGCLKSVETYGSPRSTSGGFLSPEVPSPGR